MLTRPARHTRVAAAELTLVLAGLACILLTFRDYGVSWDETTTSRYGELVVEYFRSGFRNHAADRFLNMRFYGPLFDAFAAALYRSVPGWRFEIRHLVTALAGLATVPALFALGRMMGERWAGLLAGLALATMPAFYGHAFVNTKDIPFACAFAWAMVAMTRLFLAGGLPWRAVLGCGVAFGLAAGIRPGSVTLLFLLLALGAALAALTGHLDLRRERQRGLLAKGEAIAGTTWAIMIAFWPWAHRSPLLHPALAMRVATSFGESVSMLFEGRVVESDHLPWYYLLKYVAITTPPAVLVLALLGLVAAVGWQIASPRGARAYMCLVVELWLLVPLLLWTALRPNIYDGLRHFLFVLPALALLAGIGAVTTTRAVARSIGERTALAAVVAVLLLPVRDLVRLHPYQMTYFNSLVGGLAGARDSYETDYWLTSYKEAMGWIRSQQPRFGGRVRVLAAANELSRYSAKYYAGRGVTVALRLSQNEAGKVPQGFDFYLGTTRYQLDRNYPDSPIVHTVGREGAVFAVVRERGSGENR